MMETCWDYASIEQTPCCGVSFVSDVWEPKAVPTKESTKEERNSFLLITGGRNYAAEDEMWADNATAENPRPPVPQMKEKKGTLTKLRKEGWIPLKKFRSRTTNRILTLWFKR